MIGRGKTSPTKEFEEVTNYKTDGINSMSPVELWKLGVPCASLKTYSVSVETDWTSFLMMMITFSEEFLTRTPEYFNRMGSFYGELGWYLESGKRCKRSFEKRYDMVRDYFIENYNMDLQK